MPTCPFCRKSIEISSVWCECGANLAKFPALPESADDASQWLKRYVPEMLESSVDPKASLLEQARKKLLEEQDTEISEANTQATKIREVQKLISIFLTDCADAGVPPTIDIGQLRRDRWKQWKRIPAEYKQNAPLKTFKLTPGYIFEVRVAKHKDEFCVALDGSLYKHQLNAVDPFPLDDLLKGATLEKIAEGLLAALVWLLKTKQQPAEEGAAVTETTEVAADADSQPTGRKPTLKTGGFKLPFGRKGETKEASDSEEEVSEAEEEVPLESESAV